MSGEEHSGDAPALTHVRADGTAHMVDVSAKAETSREATAQAVLNTTPEVVRLLSDGDLPKGDAFAVSRVAGIMAAKQTSNLIPLCHPLPITKVTVDFEPGESSVTHEGNGEDQGTHRRRNGSPDRRDRDGADAV